MKSGHTTIVLIALIVLVSKTNGDARSNILQMDCDDTIGEDSETFVQNFVRTLEILGTQMRTSHNATAVVGTGTSRNYGLAQCYGDLSSQDCILCYAQIRTSFPTCYPRYGGHIYLDGCFMRLHNYSFFEEYTRPNDTTVCGNVTRKGVVFQESTRRAVVNAVSGALQDVDYFAREEMMVSSPNDSEVYVLAECWKTLSPSSCRTCLENASMSITKCLPWSEGRVLNTGCFMRYSDINFFNPIQITGSSSNKVTIIAITVSVVSTVAVFTVALMIVLYIRKHRYIQHKREGSYDADKLAKILNDSGLNFKYSTVEKATGNWDGSNKLGQGGFGAVYKGALADGREIAVKRLFYNKFRIAEFYNEVKIISSLEHKNLVRLLGCSYSGPESILICEYLPNKSLDHFIFDEVKGREIGWKNRFEIIIGVAEGLVYLHENINHRIIHRDIKAANILLDLRLRPKIADFGLARSFQDAKSHISTGIAGTLGYMAPEYLAHGQLTEKADVYSFGILILEVVTGIESNRSKTTDYTDDSLLSTAWKHFKQGTVKEIFDPNLMMHIYPNINFQKDVIKVVHVALLCTQEDPSLRPSMSGALKMLVKDDDSLPAPSNPPFLNEITMELNNITQRLLSNSDGDDSSSVVTVPTVDFIQGKAS